MARLLNATHFQKSLLKNSLTPARGWKMMMSQVSLFSLMQDTWVVAYCHQWLNSMLPSMLAVACSFQPVRQGNHLLTIHRWCLKIEMDQVQIVTEKNQKTTDRPRNHLQDSATSINWSATVESLSLIWGGSPVSKLIKVRGIQLIRTIVNSATPANRDP